MSYIYDEICGIYDEQNGRDNYIIKKLMSYV